MPSTQSFDLPELGDGDAASFLGQSEGPVVVESYHAGWDKPWRALAAEDWAELGREFGERVRLATVETGGNRSLATRYALETIPQVLVFLGGRVTARFHGRTTARDVIQSVRDALRRGRALEEAVEELATLSAPARSPLRSVLRRRTDGAEHEPALTRAG